MRRSLTVVPGRRLRLLLHGGQASKCGYLFAGAGRQRRILVHCRYDFGTLLAPSAANSSCQVPGDLDTTFMLDGRRIVIVDLDRRAGAENDKKRKQNG